MTSVALSPKVIVDPVIETFPEKVLIPDQTFVPVDVIPPEIVIASVD